MRKLTAIFLPLLAILRNTKIVQYVIVFKKFIFKTPEKFPNFVQKAFKRTQNRLAFNSTPFIWDWKQWFEGKIRSIKNLTAFRAFLFRLDNYDNPVFFYKKTILDLAWSGFDGSSQGLFIYFLL